MKRDTTVIVGAGPFGLSAAAHLRAQKIPALVFGIPMEFWRKMPPRMYLKSSWSALSISDPAHAYTIGRFCKTYDISRQGLVPVQTFLKYTEWYRKADRVER